VQFIVIDVFVVCVLNLIMLLGTMLAQWCTWYVYCVHTPNIPWPTRWRHAESDVTAPCVHRC